jgi:hypothetical protein
MPFNVPTVCIGNTGIGPLRSASNYQLRQEGLEPVRRDLAILCD